MWEFLLQCYISMEHAEAPVSGVLQSNDNANQVMTIQPMTMRRSEYKGQLVISLAAHRFAIMNRIRRGAAHWEPMESEIFHIEGNYYASVVRWFVNEMSNEAKNGVLLAAHFVAQSKLATDSTHLPVWFWVRSDTFSEFFLSISLSLTSIQSLVIYRSLKFHWRSLSVSAPENLFR